jgi:hypothetical protein
MRESRPSGSVRAKAEWLSYSTGNSYEWGIISVYNSKSSHQGGLYAVANSHRIEQSEAR